MWSVYTGIVGLLVFGAINRTSAKTDQGIQLLRSAEGAAEEPRGRSAGIQKQANDFEDVDHEDNPEEHEWTELTGVIIDFDSKTLLIQTENNGEMELSGRAWRFVQESGYIPVIGIDIHMSGFYENGEFKIASFQDHYSGLVVMVRDDVGHPLWR